MLELVKVFLSVLLLLGLLHLRLCPLLLFLDLLAHLTAFLFKHDKLLMLGLHAFLVLSLLKLQLAKMLLGDTQLFVQLCDLDIVLTLFVKGCQGLLLLSLDFEQGLGLVLQLQQDTFLIFLLVFKRNNFLNVVRAFKLAAHGFDLFLVEGNLHLRLPQILLFFDDVWLLVNASGVLRLLLNARLLDVCFELFCQVPKLISQLLVLLPELVHHDVVGLSSGDGLLGGHVHRGLRMTVFHFILN